MDQGNVTAPPVQHIFLRRPPFWSISSILLAAMGSVFVLELVVELSTSLWDGQSLEGALGGALEKLVFAALAGGLLLRKLYVRSQPLPAIHFGESSVELPVSVHGSRGRAVPYDDILYLRLGGHPPHQRIFVESRDHLFFFDQPSFRDPSGPELVFLELRRRILGLPNGAQKLEAMRRRDTLAGRALAMRPWATQVLLGILVVVYLNQRFTGLSTLWAIGWGAVAPPLIRAGELYRLLSANFLHLHNLHILLNGIALFSLGGVMERFLGWERFVVVYLLSGLGATFASTLFTDAWGAAGASGCILGLFGGLAVINIRYWTELPLGFFRQSKRWWLIIIGVNSALPILVPIIDVAGHLGGFVVGAITTAILLGKTTKPEPSPPAGTGVRTLAYALSAMFAVGLGTAVWNVKDFNETKQAEVAELVGRDAVNQKQISPPELNELAWNIAINPRATPEQLELAKNMAVRVVNERGPSIPLLEFFGVTPDEDEPRSWLEQAQYEDTLATVHYRLGNFDQAARGQLDILERRPDDANVPEVLWSQLERFLAGRVESLGPLAEMPIDAFRLSIERPEGQPPHLSLVRTEDLTQPVTVYALAWNGRRREGLLRIQVGPRAAEALTYRPASVFPMTQGVTLQIAAVTVSGPERVAEGEARWSWHPTDPEVLTYP